MITFRSSAQTLYGARADTTVTKPAGVVAGDVLVFHLYLENDDNVTYPTLTAVPSGAVVQVDNYAFAPTIGSGERTTTEWVYTLVAGSAEPSAYTFTHPAVSASNLTVAAYTGVDPGNPVDVAASTARGTGNTLSAASVTTVTNNAMLVWLGADWNTYIQGIQPPGYTSRTPTGPTVICTADAIQATAGASGTVTATITGNDTYGWTAFLLALRPSTGNQPPIAGFSVTSSGLTATVTSTASDPDGTIVSTVYNWGDGTTNSLISHTYATAGTYTITQTVTDNMSSTGTVSKSVTVATAGGASFTRFKVGTTNVIDIKVGTLPVAKAYIGTTELYPNLVTGAGEPTDTGSGAALSSLSNEAWYGGPSYQNTWSRAVGAGMNSTSFFPFAVFYGKPVDGHPAILSAAGVNVFMGAERPTSGGNLSEMAASNIYLLAQGDWTAAEIAAQAGSVVGYHLADEIEMNSSYGNDAARLAALQQLASNARALNDGRFVQANFGNGALGTYWAPNGNMTNYAAAVDNESVDKYAYTSPAVRFEIRRSSYWPDINNPVEKNGSPIGVDSDAKNAWTYWWLTKMMRKWANDARPIWTFVETAKPLLTEDGATTITPGQIEGAVWASIIAGAAGISWFQHNNDNVNGTYSIVDSPDASGIRTKLTSLSGRVRALAAVINTPSKVYSFGVDKITMLKVPGDGYVYIFAMASPGTGVRTFTIPGGISGTTVTVIDESRTISISAGKFSDTFTNEYDCHIYKITI
ncbi:MAG: PKD domain-containing protein [Candidatus Microsaccharimonas sossegonensis]|uniref:PKD domain-containing protein n=1 Tax=Candidatus Microsaccharimonas sossegonensis TaxID=2506948 RepID=A0A4Q0AGJ7_9BACT|nr:MAG: PKD domain-containing protein [Candidatus Microsaccharimonas sossegonensis]